MAPPAGPAYNFIVNLYTYPGAWINGFVAAGLPISVLYLLANVFLAIVPFIPPNGDWNAEGYPYFVFPVVGVGVLLLGAVYWVCWSKLWPAVGGYRVEAHRIVEDDGKEVVRYRKIKTR